MRKRTRGNGSAREETSSTLPNPPSPRARAHKPSEIRKEIAAGMIAVGKKQGEIAKELGVTIGTVKAWRADPKVKQLVEQRLQLMLAEAGVEAKEVIATLAMQMRGSVLDILTPSGKFSAAYARRTGYDGLLKSVTIREERGRMGRGKRTVRAVITHVETHSSQSAAIELAKLLGIAKQLAKKPNDPAILKKSLDERVAFAIEGYRRGNVTLTRRDILQMAKAQAPESFSDVMPLILKELADQES